MACISGSWDYIEIRKKDREVVVAGVGCVGLQGGYDYWGWTGSSKVTDLRIRLDNNDSLEVERSRRERGRDGNREQAGWGYGIHCFSCESEDRPSLD